MRWVICGTVWSAMILVVVGVALQDWGPIVVHLGHGGEGIRVSDVIAVTCGAGVALGATWFAWATEPDRRSAAIGVRWVICTMVWAIAMISSLYVASETRLGPVVLPLSRRHGVHLSDLLVLLLGVGVAATVTVVAVLTAPRRGDDTTPQTSHDGHLDTHA